MMEATYDKISIHYCYFIINAAIWQSLVDAGHLADQNESMEVPVFEFLQPYVNLLDPVNSTVFCVKSGNNTPDNNEMQTQLQQYTSCWIVRMKQESAINNAVVFVFLNTQGRQ